jgi:hypothetical protein
VPRYHFHYRTDDGLEVDKIGSEHSTIEEAHAKACDIGKAILEWATGCGEDARLPRSIEITDAEGRDLLYVVFWASLSARDNSDSRDIIWPAAFQ